MFLVTSLTTLRERRTGTLERLLSMPLGKGDLILGYALAFGLLAVAQCAVAVAFSVGVCALEISGSIWLLLAVAVADAVLGTTLGLLASAFARTEFQVVQFMPALVFPQILLGGIFLPREQLPMFCARSATGCRSHTRSTRCRRSHWIRRTPCMSAGSW